MARRGQNSDRRAQRPGTGPQRAKPIVHATAPNRLWSWDITLLHGPGKHAYRLDAILDVLSRSVVGHRVEHTFNVLLAPQPPSDNYALAGPVLPRTSRCGSKMWFIASASWFWINSRILRQARPPSSVMGTAAVVNGGVV